MSELNADTESSPFPYQAVTADKKHVFVIVKSDCKLCWGSDKYKVSGMYLNDGSTDPLWTVDWQNYIFLPNGGKHVVRKGRWARYSATYREEVFSFIEEGNVLKTYSAGDLIAFPFLLPHSSSHYNVMNSTLRSDFPNDGAAARLKTDNGEGYALNDGVRIDNENNTIQIETFHGDKYLFDLHTGNIISSNQPSRNAAIALFCVLVIGYIAYLFLAARINLNFMLTGVINYGVGIVVGLLLFLIPIISVWLYKIPVSEYEPSYPDFSILSYLQISMFPSYLLASLNIITQPENSVLQSDPETMLLWVLFFWAPFFVCIGLLNCFVVSKLRWKFMN